MTDGQAVNLVSILTKLVLSHHRYIPMSGEFSSEPEEYVKMTGRVSLDELKVLKEALSGGAQKSDTSGDKESGT